MLVFEKKREDRITDILEHGRYYTEEESKTRFRKVTYPKEIERLEKELYVLL